MRLAQVVEEFCTSFWSFFFIWLIVVPFQSNVSKSFLYCVNPVLFVRFRITVFWSTLKPWNAWIVFCRSQIVVPFWSKCYQVVFVLCESCSFCSFLLRCFGPICNVAVLGLSSVSIYLPLCWKLLAMMYESTRIIIFVVFRCSKIHNPFSHVWC